MIDGLPGMYAALMTGLSDEGELDPDRQREIIRYVKRQGLTGLYVGGSSGESGLLDVSELLEQQAIVAEVAKANNRLIAHVGMANLRDTIKLAKNAEKLGYQALSALPPHSYPFSDDELLGYYSALSTVTELPLIVYEVPIRTGRPIGVGTLSKILELPGIAGIKFTSTDLFKMSQLRRSHPEKLIFFGFDEIYLAAGALDIHGGIGTTYNILGKLYVALNTALARSDLTAARALQEISQQFVEPLLEIGVIPGMKLAFNIIGVDCGPCRLPMQIRTPDAEDKMRAALARIDIRAWLA